MAEYYVYNFIALIDRVEMLYEDLLDPEDHRFLAAYRRSTDDAKALYVRLVTRKGPLFRSDLLNYPELNSIEQAASALADQGLLRIDGAVTSEELLALMRKPELLDLFHDVPGPRNSRKPELIDRITETLSTDDLIERTSGVFSIYEPLQIDVVDRFKLLFFGNTYQELSEFVITDLGVVTYESYVIDKKHRVFSNREQVEAVRKVHELAIDFHDSRTEFDASDLLDLTGAIPGPTGTYVVDRRRERLLNQIARQLERLGEFDAAFALYDRTSDPPSRERRARILSNKKKKREAIHLCREILDAPLSDDEEFFAQSFLPRLDRALFAKRSSDLREECIEIPIHPSGKVEIGALEYFLDFGCLGYYTENALWTSLFGLAFWDIIFADIPGVFFNEFQRGPADIATPAFYRSRRMQFETRLRELHDQGSIAPHLLDRYSEKLDVANHFVAWRHIDRSMLETTLSRINRDKLLSIFERMMVDPWARSSGLPDLIVFRGEAGWPELVETGSPGEQLPGFCFVEVKGPGDQIQHNQRRWFEFFRDAGVPAIVLWVTYDRKE